MMDIVIFSDSHGNRERMNEILARGEYGAVIHLGDGYREISDMAENDCRRRVYITVCGNCDLGSDGADEKLFTLEGVTFLALHGHRQWVKHGTEHLESYARQKGADVVLYGHTHQPEIRYIPGENGGKPLYIMNPGSIGTGSYPSFGTAAVKDGSVLLNTVLYEES